MQFAQVRISRRSIEIGTALVALVSLAIGAHAALNMRTETAKAVTVSYAGDAANKPARIALVIGNGHYPDAGAPLTQPISDARALTSVLRREGFDVDVIEDASKEDMKRALDRLKARVKPETVVMLYFGGFGIQAGRESYMIPVDATIWKESDVRREGTSVESVLSAMNEGGAHAKLAVIDASRRNPYERRFRAFSHGLAPINVPGNALILSSATPGKVADDSKGQHSLLMAELLNNLNEEKSGTAEALFGKTRVGVSRASAGEQVPSVSSSLLNDVRLGMSDEASATKSGS